MKRERERERERKEEEEKRSGREEKESGKIVREYIWGREQETLSPVTKVPKQCPLVLLVEMMHMIGFNYL
jgi:hypothetical protein